MAALSKNDEFMNLYKPLHARLCRYVQSIVWQTDDAKDLISDISLTAFERFDSLKNQEHFMFFLFGIARHLFLKKLRKQKFKAQWNESEMEKVEGTNQADSLLQKRELARLLSMLKPAQSEALSLYEVAGFLHEEIAGIQECSLSQVKANIYKTRQKLKEIVEQESRRVSSQEKSDSSGNLIRKVSI